MQTAVSEQAGAGEGRAGRADLVLWAGVVALALLRFWWLGEWGLWIDEAHTLHDAMGSTARPTATRWATG